MAPTKIQDGDRKQEPSCFKKAMKIVQPLLLLVLITFCILLAMRSWMVSEQTERSFVSKQDQIDQLREDVDGYHNFAWDHDPEKAVSQFKNLVRGYNDAIDCADCEQYPKNLAYYYSNHGHLQQILNEKGNTSFHPARPMPNESGCLNQVYANDLGQEWCNNNNENIDYFFNGAPIDGDDSPRTFHYWKAAEFMPTGSPNASYHFQLKPGHHATGQATRIKILTEGIFMLFASVQFVGRHPHVMEIVDESNKVDGILAVIGKCKGTSLPCNLVQVAYLDRDTEIFVRMSRLAKFQLDKRSFYLGFLKLQTGSI